IGAVADIIDPRSLSVQSLDHPGMQRIDVGLAEPSARDARLVGDDEDEIACAIEAPDRGGRTGHPSEPFARPDVAVVVVEYAVAGVEGRRCPLGGAMFGYGHSLFPRNPAQLRQPLRGSLCVWLRSAKMSDTL